MWESKQDCQNQSETYDKDELEKSHAKKICLLVEEIGNWSYLEEGYSMYTQGGVT
jgi:hypothetical protein